MKMKKIGALILAVMLIMSLSATAFAAENMTGESGVIGEFTNDAVAAKDKAVILQKELTAYNPASSDTTINAPTITYTYVVTPGSPDKDIYDVKTAHNPNANAHVYTKAGPTTGVIVNSGTAGNATSATGTVSWSPAETITANSTGKKNTKGIEIDFSGVAFTGAGVYRYVITESAASYTSSGVVDGTINHVRYLDVYVKDGSSAGTYDIYGYVCFINNNNIDAQDTPTAATPNTVTAAAKTEGFVATSTGGSDGSTSQTADQYYTYNVTISKTLSGDQAMNGHEFPFKVEFLNTTVTDAVLPIVSGDAGTKPTLTAGVLGDGSTHPSEFTIDGTNATAANQLKIANGQSVTFTGIPAGTTVTINEYNDVLGTVYTTTTSGGTTNETGGVTLNWSTWTSAATGWDAVTALEETANANAAASDNVTVTFTNTLLTISPTGVALRVAPYVLMLGAGIFLLVLTKRRKNKEEEAEV